MVQAIVTVATGLVVYIRKIVVISVYSFLHGLATSALFIFLNCFKS